MSRRNMQAPKTPSNNQKRLNTGFFLTPSATNSESDDSTTSSKDGTGKNLSIVADFDDLVRMIRQERSEEVEERLLHLFEQLLDVFTNKWNPAVLECQRLQDLVDKKIQEARDLESKLFHARRLLDKEREKTKRALDENDSLKIQINRVREMFLKDTKMAFSSDNYREKLSFLNDESSSSENCTNPPNGKYLSAIHEVNTTGSLLSDLSYSKSEDDIDRSFSQLGKTWKKHRPSSDKNYTNQERNMYLNQEKNNMYVNQEKNQEPAIKKRKSTGKVIEINQSETVRATTTLTINKEGPITATSIIESVPVENNVTPTKKRGIVDEIGTFEQYKNSPSNILPARNIRQHTFQPKIVVMPENCGPCSKRMRFGRNVLKCKDCKALVHPECKNELPLPCIPQLNTPTDRNLLGYIGDFTPTTSPMVPALIVHCVNEIERKGLNELGIYRVPGSERDVKALKERFLKQKGCPILTGTDIHVICGTIKDFLRSLHEPLVTFGLWKDFIKAVEAQDSQDVNPALFECISELPQPNRDTLAFLILHFKKVAEAKECKMPVENLAKVFGPTLVGYSCSDPTSENIFKETRQQVNVMECLLKLPEDYWASLLVTNNNQAPSARLIQTPSTDSLLRTNMTPRFTNRSTRIRKRFFPSPSNK